MLAYQIMRAYRQQPLEGFHFLVNQPRVVSRVALNPFCDHSFGQAIWRAPPHRGRIP